MKSNIIAFFSYQKKLRERKKNVLLEIHSAFVSLPFPSIQFKFHQKIVLRWKFYINSSFFSMLIEVFLGSLIEKRRKYLGFFLHVVMTKIGRNLRTFSNKPSRASKLKHENIIENLLLELVLYITMMSLLHDPCLL